MTDRSTFEDYDEVTPARVSREAADIYHAAGLMDPDEWTKVMSQHKIPVDVEPAMKPAAVIH
jgi:hypothetical protein